MIHVGDSLQSDVKCPGEAGIKSIWLNREGKPVPKDVGYAEGLADVLKILDGEMKNRLNEVQQGEQVEIEL